MGGGGEKQTPIDRQAEHAPTPWQTDRAPSKGSGAQLLCQFTRNTRCAPAGREGLDFGSCEG